MTEAAMRRAHRGELVSAAAALALLALMFGAKWYGVDGIPGRSQIATAENAWHALTVIRWLMLLAVAVTIASLVRHVAGHDLLRGVGGSGLVTALGALTALLLSYRVLVNPPNSPAVVDQKLGAYLGVLSAFALAFGGYDALRARRLAHGGEATVSRPLPPR
jgi:hypothetical protein